MTSSRIPVRNVYYMLSYAFRALQEQQYRKLATEPFDNIADLCAAILIQGMSAQIKRGLSREYVPHTDELDSPRGKIEITESVRKVTMSRKRLVCTVDDFTVDSRPNRIIKSTMLLLAHADINLIRRTRLRRLLACLDNVGRVDLRRIDWRLRYDRNNQTYRMLIGICHLAVNGLLQSSRPGKTLLMDFLDDQQMHRIYEKFLFGYYSREWRGLINTTHHRIPWMCSAGDGLPIMQPDVVLDNGRDVLIIDAKYYTRTMQRNFSGYTMHSANMYQMFTYVKNKTAQLAAGGEERTVSGMLLYAKTDEERQPDGEFDMGGNRIAVRTLDLNQDFPGIAGQLDDIVMRFFPGSTDGVGCSLFSDA
ncbi:5-methylcytosine-specific restriction endonuclease system specificity protein McrC [Bifidobacterium sp. 82T24]|uniref:5-methylcytosine-specific restriction endonuclease system specificity protein McrC n=1 Tax=Bifidobacterium pluvialisilvae TaxID=2834436 RepID=UPI001C55E60D|nr:5-methylcytosine-specific restriction endonuclease system specificity protein McrC [Bifidobacterium pluvialisilvae]MBW3087221.1 5-methylcytosine-specific restriction endonuclease system specificity protein McrC [Bifidobacterium pluvialisilvae]